MINKNINESTFFKLKSILFQGASVTDLVYSSAFFVKSKLLSVLEGIFNVYSPDDENVLDSTVSSNVL